MRNEINKLEINGEVVIGEGELDEAPMLYIGEKLGAGGNLDIDIAVDPLEGTNFVAKNLPGALSVIAIAEKVIIFLMHQKLIWINLLFQVKYLEMQLI